MILLCRTMAAATAPPGRAELEDLRARVERLEERLPAPPTSLWETLAGGTITADPEDDHIEIVGEYTVQVQPSYTKGFRCTRCGVEIPLVDIDKPGNRPLRVTGQVLDDGAVLVYEGLCPTCCTPRDCEP